MVDNPKVSILIPLYNAEKYIAETIESCLAQTYDNIEIIIVDDGSTDKSLSIAKEYEKDYKNIKVVTQQNSGASAARNWAFELSSGDFIQYLDADDLLHPDKIRLQIEVLKNEDKRTLAFGKWGIFYKSIENVRWKEPPVNKNYDNPKQFLIDLWASGLTVVVYAWLISRKLVEESGGWNENLSSNDDGEFSARVVLYAKKIIFVESSVGYYRKDNENSLSKQVSREALESKLNSLGLYVELMKNDIKNPEVQRSLALLHSRFLNKIPPLYKDISSEVKYRINSFGYEKPLNTMKAVDKILSYFIGSYRVVSLKKYLKYLLYKGKKI